jgi:putative tryptophan/tyrosine transport system substrate-binding protein
MRRREFIGLVGGAAVTWPFASNAQLPRKVHRIGMLETIAAEPNRKNLNAFGQGMSERGYVEARDYVIEYRSADGHTERFQALADELVRTNVDLIVTRGTPAAQAAKAATAKLPIVMSPIGDPMLVVASLSHPGGNVTGLTSLTQELAAKRASILKELVPGTRRMAALLNMGNQTLLSDWTEVQRAGSVLGFKSVLLDVRRREDLLPALELARAEHADALIVSTDTVTQANRELIAELAAKHLLPAIYPSREFVDAGGLIMYGVDYPDLYRRAAIYVDKILKGAKPADLPVEQPTKFEMVINLRVAKALGITVPPIVLAQADEVIE